MKNILKSKEFVTYNENFKAPTLKDFKKAIRLQKLIDDIESGKYQKEVKEKGKKFILGRDFYKLKNKKQ